jgi:hypothetical protein
MSQRLVAAAAQRTAGKHEAQIRTPKPKKHGRHSQSKQRTGFPDTKNDKNRSKQDTRKPKSF